MALEFHQAQLQSWQHWGQEREWHGLFVIIAIESRQAERDWYVPHSTQQLPQCQRNCFNGPSPMRIIWRAGQVVRVKQYLIDACVAQEWHKIRDAATPYTDAMVAQVCETS